MPLLTLQDIKDAFPTWEQYCTLQQTEPDADKTARLQNARDQAEGELLDYVALDDAGDLTPRLQRHLLVIIRYRAFLIKYASEDYDTKPAVVRDYERTTESLQQLRAGTQPDPYDPTADSEEEASDFRIDSKPRRFDQWFNPDEW